MYQITIIAVGKMKQKFVQAGVNEYTNRLLPYARIKVIETDNESIAADALDKEVEQAKAQEGERILTRIPAGSYVISCDSAGKALTSEELAKKISDLGLYGRSKIAFIIGGSEGLSDMVLSCSDLSLSFGKLTYPHQLMRVMLLEQVYRAMRIISNEPYHK